MKYIPLVESIMGQGLRIHSVPPGVRVFFLRLGIGEGEVVSCYERRQRSLGCVNPEFFELPVGEPAFRVLAQVAPRS